MISDILKDHRFNKVFSIILGVGIVIIVLRPICKGKSCIRERAPTVDEIKDKVFNIDNKCYMFEYGTVKCPIGADAESVIEPFLTEFARR